MNEQNKKQENLEESNDLIKDIDIREIIPNIIDNYLIAILDNHHTVVIPMHITGSHFKVWKKSRGGIFSRDVLNYTLNISHGNYVYIKTKTLNCIARIISEDEELTFKTLKLVDGQIKDRPYMILKKLNEDEKFINTQKYTNEKEIEDENTIPTPVLTLNKPSQDDDFEYRVGSISLLKE